MISVGKLRGTSLSPSRVSSLNKKCLLATLMPFCVHSFVALTVSAHTLPRCFVVCCYQLVLASNANNNGRPRLAFLTCNGGRSQLVMGCHSYLQILSQRNAPSHCKNKSSTAGRLLSRQKSSGTFSQGLCVRLLLDLIAGSDWWPCGSDLQVDSAASWWTFCRS